MKVLSRLLIGSLLVSTSVSTAEELNPLVIRSDVDKQESPLTTAPGSFVKKDRSSLKAKTPDSLGESLSGESNVDFAGGPRKPAQLPQIRGLGSERILILEDGVRQNFQSGHNGRVFSDFSLLESVEVVKGPWSSLYGSGAMGGVISFRKSTAADFIRRTGQEKGIELALDAGSAAEEFGQRATVFAKAGDFEPLVSFHHLKSQDIRLGTGDKLPYSADESNDVYSSLGYEIDERQSFTLKIEQFVAKALTPLDPELASTLATDIGDATTSKTDFVGEYKLTRGSFDFHAKPFSRKTEVKKARLSDGRTDVQTVKTTGIDLWNNWTTANDFMKSVVTTGAEYFKDENEGRRDGGTLDSFPDGSSEQSGFYFQPSLKFGKWSLIPGARYDSYRLDDSSAKATSNSGNKTSLKAYVTYEPEADRVVFLGWGQSYNAPRLQDVYVSGLHFPGNFFVANPNLKPEVAETWELGTKNHLKRDDGSVISLNGTYFLTRAQDFIARNVDIAGGTTKFDNLDRVKLQGFEVSALWQNENWGTGLSYGEVRSLNEGTDQPLADTLPDQWIGTLEYYQSEQLTLGTTMILAEKQDRVPTGTSDTAGYFTEDFYLKYDAKPVEIALRINNAFDRNYRKHNSVIEDVGRDVRATASWRF